MPNVVSKESFDVEKDENSISNLSELILSNNNYILFGTKESGKTILLDKILLETLEYHKKRSQIPVFIEFSDIKDSIIKIARDFWGKSSEEAQNLIYENDILLIIDNITFDEADKYKLKVLKTFLEDYPNTRFIGSYRQFFEEEFPSDFELVSMLNFERLTIKQFKSKQIKLLIQKWFPKSDIYDTPNKLKTLTNAFLALNLPRTPFAVSMFLWIIEKQEHYRPVNNSILIENFIEKLLKKHDKQEAFRERFGYDNKIWIMAEIAYRMLMDDNADYSISHTKFNVYIDEYLTRKKFEDYKTEKIVHLLLESGIFLNNDGQVRFRFKCFFEFFLVKRMETDPEFEKYVLSEENYLSFVDEIDYYTGLNRGKSELLKQINIRAEEGFREISDFIEKARIENEYADIDSFFTLRDEKGKMKPSLVSQLNPDEVINFLPSNKPTEEDLEIIEDRQLELQQPEKGIEKKAKGNKIKNLSKLLVLSLRVIKNSEEVSEENLKLHSYKIALKNSILFAILHKAVFQLFLLDHQKLPKERVEELETLSKHLPLLHQLFLFDNVGTSKLSSVIREKIQEDIKMNVSEFEQSLSVFIYSDIRGRDYDKIISAFIKRTKMPYIEDLIFFKLVTYFYYRSKDKKQDEFYLNLIADSVIQSQRLNKNRKSSIMENYRKKKRQISNQLDIF